MAKADRLLPKFLHFQTHIKYTDDKNIEVQLEDVTDHDFVEVVRCKDCQHYNPEATEWRCDLVTGLVEPFDDDFCSYGERRTE